MKKCGLMCFVSAMMEKQNSQSLIDRDFLKFLFSQKNKKAVNSVRFKTMQLDFCLCFLPPNTVKF